MKELFKYTKREKNKEDNAQTLIDALKNELQENMANCDDNQLQAVIDGMSGLIKLLRISVWDEMEKRKLDKNKASFGLPEVICDEEFHLIGFQIDADHVEDEQTDLRTDEQKHNQEFILHFVMESLKDKLHEKTIKVYLSKENLKLFSSDIRKKLNK